jgi:hypothetical protein
MTEEVIQGWYADPAGRHQYRWFSEAVPTDLVKDGRTTSRDSISSIDLADYQSMQLEQEPDIGPLLHKDDAPPPKLELVNYGLGTAHVINTAGSSVQDAWSPGERILIFLPFLGELCLVMIVAAGGLAPIYLLVPPLLSVLAAALCNWRRRRRRSRRLQRSVTS